MLHRKSGLPKPDPYCAFKNDVERRKALNFRNACAVVIAVVIGPDAWIHLQGVAVWLKGLLG